MKFAIIYTADVPGGESLGRYAPSGDWDRTEDDDCFDYDYLGSVWETGHHGKWCGILSKSDFDKFVDDHCLYAEDVETMGSLGAPGFGVGWSPAVSFIYETMYNDAIVGAYVTPIFDVPGVRDGRDWERIRAAVISQYGL